MPKAGVIVLAACAGLACQASAQSVTLKNDTLQAGQQGAIQLGFINDEIGAATFVIDPESFPVRVKRVQLMWFNDPGCPTAPNNIQDAILIYAGAFGDLRLQYESDPIQLTPGFLNEFDLEFENIVIQDGGVSNAITVGMRFSDAPDGDPCDASLVTDTNGCVNVAANLVFARGGLGNGWILPCQFGISGDFVIRAIVESVEQPCYPDCDTSMGAGVLDIFDFLCFQDAFAMGDPYADCDTSTGVGVLDIFDFLCFQDLFAMGCP